MCRAPGGVEVARAEGGLRLESPLGRDLRPEGLDTLPGPLVLRRQAGERAVALEGVGGAALHRGEIRAGLDRGDPRRVRRRQGCEGSPRLLHVPRGELDVDRDEDEGRGRRLSLPPLCLERLRRAGGIAAAERLQGRLEGLRVTRGKRRRRRAVPRVPVGKGPVGLTAALPAPPAAP